MFLSVIVLDSIHCQRHKALQGRLPKLQAAKATEAVTHIRSRTKANFMPARESGTETGVTHVVGDVRGKACLIVDDMISTGGTIAESVAALRAAGARPEITVAATHPRNCTISLRVSLRLQRS
jgi:phosphoribosylpyrophosphate synthetase